VYYAHINVNIQGYLSANFCSMVRGYWREQEGWTERAMETSLHFTSDVWAKTTDHLQECSSSPPCQSQGSVTRARGDQGVGTTKWSLTFGI
jgi:hypothetical protein